MGQGEYISSELILELLVDIFPKENVITENSLPENTLGIPETKSNYKTSIPFRPSISFKQNQSYISRKIKNPEYCCYYCREIGHFEKNCFKKQAFENTKRIPRNPIPSSSTYDSDFFRSISRLNQVKNCELSIEELTRLRTIIYKHPHLLPPITKQIPLTKF